MLIKVKSATNHGIDTVGIDIEVNIEEKGFPAFNIVGLADKAVGESRERVRTALQNSGIKFPIKRITVNLAPADMPKEGSFYDLPIAVAIMAAETGIEIPASALFYGELSLDGTVRHTKGAFLVALYAQENGLTDVFVPEVSANECSVFNTVNTRPVNNLNQIFNHLLGTVEIRKHFLEKSASFEEAYRSDFSNVLGQEQAKRGLEIAAAGGHNILMVGPPGGGKTMLARALPSILPDLSAEESVEVTKIYSATGNIPPNGTLLATRPFRSPHHTTSYAGLIGGGSLPKPGEISLSHRGVLFLDEFPEFPRKVLESLRQPLEDGEVTISRSGGTLTFPSRFILLAACNPCPCGFYGHPTKDCECTEFSRERYTKRLSGPILDRIDLHVKVSPVPVEDLSPNSKRKHSETSKVIKSRVVKARKIQQNRLKDYDIFTNSEMQGPHLDKFCNLSADVSQILNQATEKFSLSARSYFKVIKVARTIADLAGEKDIKINHITEALQFRS